MKAICSISDKQELKEMGIPTMGHRSLLMREIQKLQLKENRTSGGNYDYVTERDSLAQTNTFSDNTDVLFSMHNVNIQQGNPALNASPPPPQFGFYQNGKVNLQL